MKSILLGIQPKWCEKISSGEKTVEIRKTRPKIETPFKCYIYCTINGTTARERDRNIFTDLRGKVIGEFICNCIDEFEGEFWNDEVFENINLKYNPSDYGEDCDYRCSRIAKNRERNWLNDKSCLTWEELRKYVGKGIHDFYGWHISDLVIYDKPKDLNQFVTKQIKNTIVIENNIEGIVSYPKKEMIFKRLTRPPQSWCYVEELEE